MRTPAYPFFPKKKILIRVRSVLVRVGYDKVKPYFFSTWFSATQFSLFSAHHFLTRFLDSLCLLLSHSTAGALGSLSLTSSFYRRQNGRSDCGSEDLRQAGNRGSFIMDLIVVFSNFFSYCGSDCSDCGIIFVNMQWVCGIFFNML